MRKHLSKILLAMAVSGAVAFAQASSPQSSSSPDQSTSPSTSSPQSTSPSSSQYPSSASQAAGAASGSLSQAQSQIQDALTKQMPSSNVSVSATSDNQLQLSGSVSSAADKQKAEDIAKSAAPGQTIVNNIKVSGSSSETNPK